ncbi:NAD(P)H oxidoreductase [Paenibacillus sp. TCA20]|uniref:NAD(P)H oxidoreductase n=1 Tax=Paenibacillus urinalis TaxID=521520 RepID=A0AAX3MXQ3_9BACL|nr:MULTISPECIES: NAD(P)H oxidoreductase [Paenibacillus]WDH82107.1 NAD(P)H oxidoreductase [Paenibacillus urinalis]GAK42623.1 NAD(P)H oxidoreductase [Paenibacillus sp. TCA20]
MRILSVVCHPRTSSLTFAVAERFVQGLKDAGHESEVLDLHRHGFNPVLGEADEPDWSDSRKIYSPEVEAEMERMRKHDALAYIFPIWWYSMPAMLKGYIDRVWNNGFAYGANQLHHRQVLWLGLAGAPPEHFEKRQYDKMLSQHLNVGIASYSGIPDSRVEILYDTLNENAEYRQGLLQQAYQLGLEYCRKPA